MPHRVRQFRGSVRRRTDWSATAPETSWSNLAAATSVIDSTFVLLEGQNETITRVRGLLSVDTDQQAATERPHGAFGICIVSDQAVAAGVASVPSPYTEADSDLWLLHQFWATNLRFSTAVGFRQTLMQYELDSKAMRKISVDETLIAVMENAAASHGVDYRLDFRILTKLT